MGFFPLVHCREGLSDKKTEVAWVSWQERGFFGFPQRRRERRRAVRPWSRGLFATLGSSDLFLWVPGVSSRGQKDVLVMISCNTAFFLKLEGVCVLEES